MKKFNVHYLLLALLLGHLHVNAQVPEIPVRFTNGNFFTGNNMQQPGFNRSGLQSSRFQDNYYVLVQFSGLPSPQIQQQLKTAGLELESYLPGNAYLATIRPAFDFLQADQYGIISINTVPPFYKIDKAVYDTRWQQHLVAVRFYHSMNRATVMQELQSRGALIVETKYSDPALLFIQVSKAYINSIAELPFITYVGLQDLADKPLNYKSMGKYAVTSLLSPSGKNLSGKGVAVGVGDNSEIITPHLDFTGRVINRVPFPFSFHGVHVSGTVAGGGLLDPRHNGMAPRATIVSQYLSDIITGAPVYAADHNMVVTNNSYTNAQDSCAGTGAYDVVSNYVDRQMGDLEKMLHVFAAGNDGLNTCSPYPTGYATIKSGYQCAKNVLTVGGLDTLYAPLYTTSRGPVNDGRLKPEIVATGLNVLSTRHNFTYGTSSGTSMASPIVAGTATLLYEQYRKLNGNADPQAALIKAVLCNTAEDLGARGPDFTYGFGYLNARRAAEAIQHNRYYLSTTLPSTNSITVPAGVRRLKVMLYWADTAAAPNAASTLVNDLDLTVTAPGNITHLPLVLDHTSANVTDTAVEAVDRINNIEQVVIDSPAPGTYDINVSAFAMPFGPQQYVITYQLDTNGVTLEYPYGEEKLVPGQTETIRWNAYGDENNTFTLEYFNGTAWNLVDNNIPANRQHYDWIVPSTVSNNYRFRVSRNGSAYADESNFDVTVIGQPVVTATVPCDGFAKLDWPPVPGATSYDIWQLKADTMAIIGNATDTTFIIPGLSSSTTYWFGVSAKNGSVNGRRSLSRSVLPSTGVCSLAIFNNNMKAVSINAPVTGRQFTSSALTSTETIRFTIRNNDDAATSGTYDLYYQVNGGTVVMETGSAVIPALGSMQFSFATTANLSATGIYTIRAWVKRPGWDPLESTCRHASLSIL